LFHAAWAATHTKQTHLAAQFKRVVRIKGKKRALIAVGHIINGQDLRAESQGSARRRGPS